MIEFFFLFLLFILITSSKGVSVVKTGLATSGAFKAVMFSMVRGKPLPMKKEFKMIGALKK